MMISHINFKNSIKKIIGGVLLLHFLIACGAPTDKKKTSSSSSQTPVIDPGTVTTGTKLVFATQPSTTNTAGNNLTVQPVIEVQDESGVIDNKANIAITIALTTGTGTLSGTATMNAVNGIAAFTGLSVNLAGNNKILTVSASGLTSAASNTFNVSAAAAAKLVFTTQPNGGVAGTTWTQQPVIEVQDSFGNLITSGSQSISLALSTGTGTLSGTKTVVATGGVATFTNLSLDLVGTNKVLTASSSGLTSATTTSFSITAATPAKLAFVYQPGGGPAGAVWIIQPVLQVQDNFGNAIYSASNSISLTLTSGAGAISGTTTINATSGLAAFSGLSISSIGADKVITASSSGLTSAVSNVFAITSGPAAKLVFQTQPGGGVAGNAWSQQPVILVQDAGGNTVTSATTSVSLSLSTGTGTISGTTTLSAIAGVVNFSGLSIDIIGTGKVITASATGLTSAISNTFSITAGPPTKLAFGIQPSGGIAGTSWSQQPVVYIQDAGGNIDTSATNSVTLNLTTGSGTLSGTATVVAVAGVATFSGLSLDLIGSDKILTASSSGLTSTNSSSFTITPAAVISSSTVSASPNSIVADNSTSTTVTVTLVDSFGNPVSGKVVSVSSDLGSVTGSPTSSDASGVATFTLKSSTAGTATISAIGDGITLTTQPSVTIESWTANLANCSWSADPVTIGSGESTIISFEIRNASHSLLKNKPVSLSSSRGASDSIVNANTTTDMNGIASFTVSSSTVGEATLTATVTDDIVSIPGTIIVLNNRPVLDLQARFAEASITKISNGSNLLPTSTWGNLDSLGSLDGVLNNFAFNTSTSGWYGDGTSIIASNVTGPFRLNFDGSSTFVDVGNTFSSATAITASTWIRPANVAATNAVILSTADISGGGLMIRQSYLGNGKLEMTLGDSKSYTGEILADAPTSYWRLGETSGTSASDLSNSGYNGTITGSPVLGGGSALADNDSSINFNGSGKYITATGTNLNLGSATSTNYSVEAWIKLNSMTGSNQRIVHYATTGRGYSLYIDSTGHAVFEQQRTSSTFYKAIGSTVLSTGTWYHLVGTKTNGSVKIYVNGIQDGSGSFTNTSASATGLTLYIGQKYNGSERFDGFIDEVATYKGTALSLTRIQNHYNARTIETCYSSSQLANNFWYNIAGSYDNSTKGMNLYINGTNECSRTATNGNLSSSYNLGIGAQVDGTSAAVSGTYWSGAVGEVRVWDSVQTSTQVNSNYVITSGRFP